MTSNLSESRLRFGLIALNAAAKADGNSIAAFMNTGVGLRMTIPNGASATSATAPAA